MSVPRAEILERSLTLKEFIGLPEEAEYRLELSRGRLVREPRPGAKHSWIVTRLIVRLSNHAEDRGLGLVFTDTGFELADDPPTVRIPDLAFIAEENLPAEIPSGFWRIPPELAVEVLSPSNTAEEIHEKVLEYLQAGSRLVWVVDPRNRSVLAYRSRDDIRILTEGDALEGADVLPGFQLPIADLFAPHSR